MPESEDAYQTIDKASIGEYREKGSKFITYLFPVTTKEAFATRLNEIRNEHFKASHHCPAFRLRSGLYRSSDDGEPSGSAGKPMMNQLLSAELVDVGCVCVRYFGGTKLGVSGLINAYKTSVADAIHQANVITKYETVELVIKFDYAIMGSLMDCIKQLGLDIKEKNFSELPRIILSVNKSEAYETVMRVKAKMIGRSVEDIQESDKIPGMEFLDFEKKA